MWPSSRRCGGALSARGSWGSDPGGDATKVRNSTAGQHGASDRDAGASDRRTSSGVVGISSGRRRLVGNARRECYGRRGGRVKSFKSKHETKKLPIRRVFSGRFDWRVLQDAQAHNRCAFALMQVLLSLLNPDPCLRRPKNPEIGHHDEWDAHVSMC